MSSILPKRNTRITKDRSHGRFHINLMLCCVLLFAAVLACVNGYKANAATGIKLYDYETKKTYVYTGQQVKVLFIQKQISKDSTPGIIENGIALLSYKDIFADSALKAECVYNKDKGTVTISQYGTTIVMTINSRTAYVNGKAVQMPVAPVKIKYVNAEVTKILVPSRFVAETLGYTYTWISSKSTVVIERNFLGLSYNGGEPFVYQGDQGLVTIDGVQVNPGNMPSVIYNNTAMLRAKQIFSDSDMKASYHYNKTTKAITLIKGDIRLQMEIGSKTAYINDKPITIDTAPMIVTNSEGTNYVMVPGRFTANSLGYDYEWDAANKISVITSTEHNQNNTDGNGQGNIPDDHSSDSNEPGSIPEDSNSVGNGSNNDNSMENLPNNQGQPGGIDSYGEILKQWQSDPSSIGTSSGLHELTPGPDYDGKTGFIYGITRDFSNTKLNAETFAISSISPFGKVASISENNIITVNIENMVTDAVTVETFGTSSNMVDSIQRESNQDLNTKITFSIISDGYTYDLALSDDKLILYVTVYFNSLKEVVVGTNDQGDFVTIKAMNPLKVDIQEQDSLITLNLPFTFNGLSNQFAEVSNAKFVNLVYLLGSSNYSQIILNRDMCEYFISANQNEYTISLGKPLNTGDGEGTATPDEQDNSNEPTDENNPSNNEGTQEEEEMLVDPSKYEITIAKPSDIDASDIDHEDYYWKNQFAIKIKGDYRSFYKNNPVELKSSIIKDVSVTLNSNNETEICFTTTKLQGYRFDITGKGIYVHIGDPKNIYKNIVVLDPGHGGAADGAMYGGYKEKDLNFKMLYTIGKKYFNSPSSDIKVYYTRVSDKDVTLDDRAAFAKKVGADLFVSLHMNASTSKQPYGTEVYYSNSNNKANKAGLTSQKLAQLLVDKLSSKLGTYNRGAKSARYAVVHRNTVPAVLIELGFMSNSNDLSKLTNAEFQEKAVKTIYDTLSYVFEKYPTGR